MFNWQEKVRQYELLVNREDKFLKAIKLTMLQNTVSPVEHLKRVKDTAEQLKVSLGHYVTYEGYEKLLKHTVISHDSKLGVQPAKVTRRVCEHNLEYYEPPDPGEELDINSPIDMILAHKTLNNCKPSNTDSLIPEETH